MKLKELFEKEDTEQSADKEETSQSHEPDDATSEPEDVGSVAKKAHFKKSKKSMFAFGKTRPVTLLSKDESLGGLDLTYQYVINPKTGAWSFKVGLAGQDDQDMVEHSTGEDPNSLIDSLKKSKKVTPHWAAENLNPPPAADKLVTDPEKEPTDDL